MNKKGLTILLTGGTGFIGSHIAEELLKRGYKDIISTYITPGFRPYFRSQELDRKITMEKCDIRDFARVKEVFAKHEPDAVMHLAAQAIVDNAYMGPRDTFDTNIMGTVNVLEACRRQGEIKAIIVASSDKAYGKSKQLPYQEDYALQGDHPYDVSKTCTDLIARTYYKTYRLPIAVTRFGNVYGPGDMNFSRIIPGAMEAIIKNQELPIRSDGKMIREYVYVKDVADGYIKLLEKALSERKVLGQAFNFGSNNIFNVLEVLGGIEKALDSEIKYKILNVSKNEIPEQYLDWTKAKKVLHWKPSDDFAQSIHRTYQWYKNFYQK